MPSRHCLFLSTPSARRATGAALILWTCRTDFYPRPPRGGRLSFTLAPPSSSKFLSTPSARRATPSFAILGASLFDFYPRPPRGGRQADKKKYVIAALEFLSTPSARRATTDHDLQRLHYADFYPRPPRGGRHHPHLVSKICAKISIHALREEGDHAFFNALAQNFFISIHALREEGDCST